MSGQISPMPDPGIPPTEPIAGLPDPMTNAADTGHESGPQMTGHTVVDGQGAVIGKVNDVIFGGPAGQSPKWLVIDVGLLGVSHYAPADGTTLSDSGAIVAPFDKHLVKSAPKAHRDHIVTGALEAELERHYSSVG